MSKGFSQEEVDQFKETFNMFDVDGGGEWHRRGLGHVLIIGISIFLFAGSLSTCDGKIHAIFIYCLFYMGIDSTRGASLLSYFLWGCVRVIF